MLTSKKVHWQRKRSKLERAVHNNFKQIDLNTTKCIRHPCKKTTILCRHRLSFFIGIEIKATSKHRFKLLLITRCRKKNVLYVKQ